MFLRVEKRVGFFGRSENTHHNSTLFAGSLRFLDREVEELGEFHGGKTIVRSDFVCLLFGYSDGRLALNSGFSGWLLFTLLLVFKIHVHVMIAEQDCSL